MGIAEAIRILLVRRGNISEAEMARRLGQSPQNFHRKMKRGHFTIPDLEEVCQALDLKLNISFTFNDSNEEFKFRG